MAALDFVEQEVTQDLCGIFRINVLILLEELRQLDDLLTDVRADVLDHGFGLLLDLLIPSLIQLHLKILQLRVLPENNIL